MAAKIKVVVTGIKDVDKRLRALPLKTQKRVVSPAVRDGMKLIARALRIAAPFFTGITKANVVVRAGLKRKRGQVSIDARIDANDQTKKTSGKTGKAVFYPAVYEYGVKGKAIPAHPWMLMVYRGWADAVRKLTIRRIYEGFERVASGS